MFDENGASCTSKESIKVIVRHLAIFAILVSRIFHRVRNSFDRIDGKVLFGGMVTFKINLDFSFFS